MRNRLLMTAELGGQSVVMHVPVLTGEATGSPECDNVRRSMDALVPTIRQTGVRIAFENMAHDKAKRRSR